MPKTEWLKQYAQFQGRAQQAVAEDMIERDGDKKYTYGDIKDMAVLLAAGAFELYTAAVQLELERAEVALRRIESLTRDHAGHDVEWADREPGSNE